MRRIRLLDETRRNRIIPSAAVAAVTPLTIWGANVVAWYSSKDSDMYVENTGPGGTPVSNGSAIGYVQDLSGNGYHITQATAGKKPTYNASRASFNNQPVMSYDGGDNLQKAFGTSYTQPNTVLILKEYAGVAGTYAAYDTSDINTENAIYITGGNFQLYAGAGFVAYGAANTNVNSHVVIFAGVSTKYYVNGGTAKTGNPGTNAAPGVTLGAFANETGSATCFISEVVVIDGTATPGEINALLAQWLIDYGISYTEITA